MENTRLPGVGITDDEKLEQKICVIQNESAKQNLNSHETESDSSPNDAAALDHIICS
jgi:hypothetical protein